MKPNEPSSENREFYKRLLLVLITAIITVAVYKFLHSPQVRWMLLTKQERYEDTAIATQPVKEDSVQITAGKIPASTFESNYSAESWYSDFKSNKVAFDKRYDEQKIDIHGIITQITNDSGCAQIVMKGSDDGVLNYIEFSNCLEEKDRWSDEVAKTAVGQDVHIRGIYSGQLSNNYEMSLYKCQIINDN